ncbi:MAG: hypothetical protein ACFB2W_06940 [Leptolyngbyaceae cyanobacterium]
MAKVSVRDALLADLQGRYPTESLSTSDRILKLITEVDTLKGIVGVTGDISQVVQHTAETNSNPTDALAESMMDSLIGSVNVE